MRRGPRKSNQNRARRREHRLNNEINVPEVRLVKVENLGVDSLKEGGIYKTSYLLGIADELELDLVEIVPKANPPVCRVIEYSKLKYEIKKREKEQKSKQHAVVVKEIRFGPNTDDHDFTFKLRHAEKFLEEGNKLKAYVQFRGRNIVFKDRGREILNRFAEALEEHGKVEMKPKMEGRRMIMIMTPIKAPAK